VVGGSLFTNLKIVGVFVFKELRIWEKGMSIAEKCYSLTKGFPKEETYGMTQQI
jgi:hypothetical protein